MTAAWQALALALFTCASCAPMFWATSGGTWHHSAFAFSHGITLDPLAARLVKTLQASAALGFFLEKPWARWRSLPRSCSMGPMVAQSDACAKAGADAAMASTPPATAAAAARITHRARESAETMLRPLFNIGVPYQHEANGRNVGGRRRGAHSTGDPCSART